MSEISSYLSLVLKRNRCVVNCICMKCGREAERPAEVLRANDRRAIDHLPAQVPRANKNIELVVPQAVRGALLD